jgi:hypothetical protein
MFAAMKLTSKVLRVLFICSSAMTLISCTNTLLPLVSWVRFASPVTPSFQVDENTAVIYGSFSTGPDFAFGNELGLRFVNIESKKETIIRMQDKNAICAVTVKPGKYRVAGFVAAFIDRRTAGRRSFSNTPWFEVKPGLATYVGDFAGQARIGGLSQQWSLTGLTNNFSNTTSEYKQKYPNLLKIPLVSAFDYKLE